MRIIEEAVATDQRSLSEFLSKRFLAYYGIPVCKESLVQSEQDAVEEARRIGFPVVLKVCGAKLAHKTERNLIRLWLRGSDDVLKAYRDLTWCDPELVEGILVQEMVPGHREMVIGFTRDPHFGPCVMFGFGGMFTEVINDVSFRLAPVEERDAMEMMHEIRSKRILESFRGEKAVDTGLLAESLVTLGRIGIENPLIREIDINPMKFRDGKPVAVDALVILEENAAQLKSEGRTPVRCS
ncbi:MAG: acetate--CoA ligase family protein [Acidobacteriota bacterium]